jgi:hypothetical protein
MKATISLETAQRIFQAWEVAESMPHAMALAGLETKDRRNMHKYRRQAEDLLGVTLPTKQERNAQPQDNFPRDAIRYNLDHSYTIAAFSDGHFWPGNLSPAYWLFLEVVQDIEPEVVMDGGDSLDGATISRHPPSFSDTPTLTEEIDAVQEAMGLIQEAAGEADLLRCVGNHDLRLEAFLAKHTPQFKGMPGTLINHYFPNWENAYSHIFNEKLVFKHRWHGGVHAAHNNTVKSGVSIATGHTHRLNVSPWSDYNGVRYGVELGTVADIGPQFEYTENNPLNWQPGFMIITVDENGIHPEPCPVINNQVRFRGKVYR